MISTSWDFLSWRRVATWCWQRIATHVEQEDNCRTCVPLIPPTEGHNGDNFCQSLVRFYQATRWPRYFMNDQLEDCRCILCFIIVPNDIPFVGGGGGNFTLPFVRDRFLEGNLLSNPLLPFFGLVSEEGDSLGPPPKGRVKKRWLSFPKSKLKWVQLLPLMSLSTLTCVI